MADLLPLNIASCIITGFFTKNSLVPIYAQVIYLHVFLGESNLFVYYANKVTVL